jgi:hypothetical protein
MSRTYGSDSRKNMVLVAGEMVTWLVPFTKLMVLVFNAQSAESSVGICWSR